MASRYPLRGSIGLTRPLVVVGKSEVGIDFDARDGKPAKLVMMILTGDDQSQHDLLADASELFSQEAVEAQAFERDHLSGIDGRSKRARPMRTMRAWALA